MINNSVLVKDLKPGDIIIAGFCFYVLQVKKIYLSDRYRLIVLTSIGGITDLVYEPTDIFTHVSRC